jgi:hypothetical protein
MNKLLQLPLILFLSFFLTSCGETIDGNTSEKDYFGSNKRRGEAFVFEYKGIPFTGKVKNIEGSTRISFFLNDLYSMIPTSYRMGGKSYYFNITPEILSFKDGKLEGEYKLLNFMDEEVYVVKFSNGKLISSLKNGIEENLSEEVATAADSTSVVTE